MNSFTPLNVHPLALEDRLSEALAVQLRTASHCGRLLSRVQDLGRGDWLVARPGARMTLTSLLENAIAAQAFGVVVDQHDQADAEDWVKNNAVSLAIESLPDLMQRAGILAAAFYGRPSDRLSVSAITGTNGKTTVTQALARSWALMGCPAVSIGTLGVHRYEKRGGQIEVSELVAATLTSLDSVSLQWRLSQCLEQGIQEVVLEASSIGLAQYRLSGCRLKDVALTSFSQDHLDFHQTLQAYAQAKALLFGAPGLRGSVRAVPITGQASLPDCLTQGEDILWVRAEEKDTAVAAQLSEHQVCLQVDSKNVQARTLRVRLPGTEWLDRRLTFNYPGLYNLQNAAVMVGLLYRRGVSPEVILDCLCAFELPPGRMQRLGAAEFGKPSVFVDYAHTPDALSQVLGALRPVAQARGGRLICVFGCGGNRDVTKRPAMACVAAEYADWLVVTSDNPRAESPRKIIQDILSGLSPSDLRRCSVEEDRQRAIDNALESATAQDVVLIAGKGHETTQEVCGVSTHFDDRLVAKIALDDWYPMPSLGDLFNALADDGAILLNTEGVDLHAWKRRPMMGLSIDSRNIQPGAIFIAIKGERFDGHDFLDQAFNQGAAVAIVAQQPRPLSGAFGNTFGLCIAVKDTQRALARVATLWRKAWRGRLAVVTGSNGKTTVKEMTAAVMRAEFGLRGVWATPGNLNNHLGLPLSLLGLRPRHQVAVLEVGMNHPGEVTDLAQWASPDIALITNAQREHQEFMASVAACAEENAQSFKSVRRDGLVVVPRDLAHENLWHQMPSHRSDLVRMRFGLAQDVPGLTDASYDVECLADVQDYLPLRFHLRVQLPGRQSRLPQLKAEVSHMVEIPGIGEHVARNAAAAASIGLGLGISLKQVVRGLSSFRPVDGRGRLHILAPECWLVDDSYNANPDSVLAAIHALARVPGHRALVLGDMGEVGDQGPAFHEEVLRAAEEKGIDAVWLYGQAMSQASRMTGIGRVFDSMASLISGFMAWLESQAPSGHGQDASRTTIWIKGSRFMQMERLVQAIVSGKDRHALAGFSVAG